MNILGITALTHDSGVSLVRNNKLDVSINEERLSRIKMHAGFPELSYKYIKDYIKDINYVAVSDLGEKEFLKRTKGLVFDKSLFNRNPIIAFKSYAMMSRWKIKTYFLFKRQQEELRKKIGKFVNIEHHPAHAASVYFTMGLNKVLIITCDNHGDNLTTTISIGEKGTIKQIDSINWPHSPGFFYAIITRILGFTPGKHEGKITGLAAYGNPNSESYEKIKKLMWYENGTIKTRSLIGSRGYVKSLLRKYSREDLSAVFQRILEETVTQYIKYWIGKTGIKNIGLAGGVFANVKLNQKIKELGVENIFVFPHMGDGGTGAGAALYLAMEKEGIKPYRLKDAYLGFEYSNKEIKEELNKSNLKYEHMEDIEYQVADLLSKKKVIARFNGAMEFGPRALGNRSILYQATDPKVNDWLNKQLKRSEFMPFAPVTLEEYSNKCFENLKGAEHAAEFMTITFNCTNYMKENSPATIHVDNTARPQIIRKEVNPSYYKILNEYRKITKIPTLVNTSFNMHEEPIVCNPYDAIRAFKLGHLDYLAIGNYLVKNQHA